MYDIVHTPKQVFLSVLCDFAFSSVWRHLVPAKWHLPNRGWYLAKHATTLDNLVTKSHLACAHVENN